MPDKDEPGGIKQAEQAEQRPPPDQQMRPQAQRERTTRQKAPQPSRAAFLRSFVYAFNGLRYAVRTQRNARVHLVIAILAIGMGLWLGISPVEWGLVFVAITGVFIAEMLNTVVEACVDLATQEYHPLAKVAKDVAAGTVLLNAILSIIIGLFVFGPHLFPMIGRLLHH
ncbi:MAG TPA: diacylglycerol kinase family protein [Ktedonobacterales bacterium]|jgi:diacylglycerol kinase